MGSLGLKGVGDVRPPATGGIGGGNGSRMGGPLGPVITLGAFAPRGGVLGDVGLWGVVLGAVIVGASVEGEAGLGVEVPGAGVGEGDGC